MAKLVEIESIKPYFHTLDDPRHAKNRKHALVDVTVIALCGVLCGCGGPTAIHRWAANRLDWLKTVLPLADGLPSRDCIRRLLIALKPEAFQTCLQAWVASVISVANATASDTPAAARRSASPAHLFGRYNARSIRALRHRPGRVLRRRQGGRIPPRPAQAPAG